MGKENTKLKTKDMKNQDYINETLEMIKEQTGLELQLCDYFTGIKYHAGKPYFNVMLDKRTSESADFVKLERFSDKYKSIEVAPNGVNIVAIYFTEKN